VKGIKLMDSKELHESPSLPDVRVGKLDTLSALRDEMARLYRAARRTSGVNPDAATAAKLAYLLTCIGRSLEGSEIERRIQELEAKAEGK
jgi:hypothetical protein